MDLGDPIREIEVSPAKIPVPVEEPRPERIEEPDYEEAPA
jgi:hypothetical protein